MTFENLSLHPKILKALAESNYNEPTEIQNKAIPKILKGFDIKASAQTGTGKTAAFLLPAIHKLITTGKTKGPKVLVLSPTRELAMQIATQAEKYSAHFPKIKTVCIAGGVPYHLQMRKLQRPYDILIATPGRLIDYLQKRKINLSQLEMLVLDEADRMLDMGFVDAVEEIVAATPSSKQTLLFSATMKGMISDLCDKLLKNPLEIVVHPTKSSHENIKQIIHFADDLSHKNKILDHLLNNDSIHHAIIFTSTKRHADQLVDELKDKGHKAAALHGDMSQPHRTRTIAKLRSGKIKLLIATDVAARGIDIQTVSHVINFDFPRNVEDYVHRIGRTGRAGMKGSAFSLIASRDSFMIPKVEKYTGHTIQIAEIPGLEPRNKKSPPRKRNSSRKRNPWQRSKRSSFRR